jgi:hypothetical protein
MDRYSLRFFGRGFTISQAAQRAPKKPRTRSSRAPCARGVHAPTAGATATPPRSSRRRTGRRDPHRRRTRRPSCLRRSLEHQTPASVRPAAGLRRCVRFFFDSKFRPAANNQGGRRKELARSCQCGGDGPTHALPPRRPDSYPSSPTAPTFWRLRPQGPKGAGGVAQQRRCPVKYFPRVAPTRPVAALAIYIQAPRGPLERRRLGDNSKKRKKSRTRRPRSPIRQSKRAI